MKENEIQQSPHEGNKSDQRLRIIDGKPVIDTEGNIIGYQTCDGSLDYASPIEEDVWIDIKIKK